MNPKACWDAVQNQNTNHPAGHGCPAIRHTRMRGAPSPRGSTALREKRDGAGACRLAVVDHHPSHPSPDLTSASPLDVGACGAPSPPARKSPRGGGEGARRSPIVQGSTEHFIYNLCENARGSFPHCRPPMAPLFFPISVRVSGKNKTALGLEDAMAGREPEPEYD